MLGGGQKSSAIFGWAVRDTKLRNTTTATMAPSNKTKSLVIKLISSAGTGFFYTTTKNPRNVTWKLALKKYDPVVRKHVMFTESKMK